VLHRPDLREALRYVFEEQIPFGRALNLKIPPAARFLLRQPGQTRQGAARGLAAGRGFCAARTAALR